MNTINPVNLLWLIVGTIIICGLTVVYHDCTGKWPWQDDDNGGAS